MKLKQWLKEKHGISYADYKKMDIFQQGNLMAEFDHYNAKIQKKKHYIEIGELVIRKMTPEEQEELEKHRAAVRKRYEMSLAAGGIDETGNFTALHHR